MFSKDAVNEWEVDIFVAMEDESQALEADELFSRIQIIDD